MKKNEATTAMRPITRTFFIFILLQYSAFKINQQHFSFIHIAARAEKVKGNFSSVQFTFTGSGFVAIYSCCAERAQSVEQGIENLRVHYTGNAVAVRDKEAGKVLNVLALSPPSRVNHNPALGDHMTVLDGRGILGCNKGIFC